MDNNILKQNGLNPYLGLSIAENLQWKIHIYNITSKANFTLGLHGPSMFAVQAKIYGVLYNQASSIAFDGNI